MRQPLIFPLHSVHSYGRHCSMSFSPPAACTVYHEGLQYTLEPGDKLSPACNASSRVRQVSISLLRRDWRRTKASQNNEAACVSFPFLRLRTNAALVQLRGPSVIKLFKSPKIHYGVLLQPLTGTLIRANTETD